MKTTKTPGRMAGFTLVELLVVIGIIGLLMALLFPAISAVKNQANKARAGAVINQLGIAANAYYNEYNRWPKLRTSSELVYVFAGLRDPLTGQDMSGSMQSENPRKIAFMDFKARDVSSGSAGAQGQVAFYDPWGTPYAYSFDNGQQGLYYVGPGMSNQQQWSDKTAYDNTVDKPFQDGNTQSQLINAGFAFFSNGPDTRTGTAPSDPNASSSVASYEDDVRSWK
ncbi:MAG: type II secretion system protein [Verrucomicrobia bacterium]|nr:type II secretion system protein [Verrucomicrobiota bacterium]